METASPPSTTLCVACGEPLPAGRRGGPVCARCLIASVLEPAGEQSEPPADTGLGSFGDYDLLAVAGRGGMGVVYRARHRRLGREVALKMVASPVLAGEAAAQRFRVEVETAAGLDHPNLVPIYEGGEIDGQPYFTMKVVNGGPLSDRLRDSAWPLAAKIHLLVKVVRAVDYAHRHGVLHRDLKPTNILVDDTGEPYVCDFGLARRLEGESGLTLEGAALGTPEYMAPEQAGGEIRRTGTAADIYSLGAVLYEMLTGRPPFHGDTALETLRQVVEQDVPAPSSVSRVMDRDLETVALKCLAREPARRYATAGALADDLERWERHEPVSARRPGVVERTGKWMRRHPAGASVLGVLVVGATVLFWQRWQEARRLKVERDRAEAGWATAEARLYSADMEAAGQGLARGDFGVVESRLDAHRPRAGENDRRGLEWHIFQRAAAGDQSQTLAARGAVRHLAWTPDGTGLAASTTEGRLVFWPALDGAVAKDFPDPARSAEATIEALRQLRTERLAKTPGAPGAGEAVEHLLFGSEKSKPDPTAADATFGLCFSPGGRWLAAGGRRGTQFWRVNDGSLGDWLPGHGGVGFFIDDNRYLVADIESPHEVGVFDFTTGTRRRVLDRGGPLLAMTPDRAWAAVVDPVQRVMTVLSLGDERVAQRWEDGRFADADGLILDREGHRFFLHTRPLPLIASGDWALRRWDKDFGAQPYEDTGLMAASPDRGIVAVLDRENHVRLRTVADGEGEAVLKGIRRPVRALAWSPQGARLATAELDGSVRIWATRQPERRWWIADEIAPALVLDPDSRHALARKNGAVVQLDLQSGQTTGVAGTTSARPLALDSARGTLTVLTKDHAQGPLRLEERRLDGTARATPILLRDTETSALHLEDARLVRLVAGRWLVGRRDYDTTFAVWDARDGSRPAASVLSWGSFVAVDVSSDGSRLVAAGQDGTLSVFTWPAGERLISRQVEAATTQVLQFLPGASRFAAGDQNGALRFFDTATLAVQATLSGHTQTIFALLPSPDGSRLLSVSGDSSMRLWSVPAGQALGRLPGLKLAARDCPGFTPDGQAIVALQWGGSLLVWRGAGQ